MPRSLLHPHVRPFDSPIAGRGLVATAPIGEGETVAEIAGSVMSDAEFRRYVAAVDRFHALAIDEDRHLVQDLADEAGLGNHSCDPNTWMGDALTTVARRPIRAGEEVTIDYALHTVDPGWSMPCRCGAVGCRGVVTGDDWRRADVRAAYRGHFSPFIDRRIDAEDQPQ